MKLLGAILVFGAFAAAGITKVAALKTELATLRGIIRLIEMIKNEIVTRRTTVRRIADRLPEHSDRYTSAFAVSLREKMCLLGEMSLGQLWSCCVSKELTALNADCREALTALGDSIGRYDAELQQEAFERCIQKLSKCEQVLTEAYSGSRKLYFGTFGAAGMIAVIVLI